MVRLFENNILIMITTPTENSSFARKELNILTVMFLWNNIKLNKLCKSLKVNVVLKVVSSWKFLDHC